MDFAKCFLVMTWAASDALRACWPGGAEVSDTRRVAVPILAGAELLGTAHDRRGEVRVYRWSSGKLTGTAEVVLGVDRQGRPRLAPDGHKRMAFCTIFTVDGRDERALR